MMAKALSMKLETEKKLQIITIFAVGQKHISGQPMKD
jgi:hypothetical protein